MRYELSPAERTSGPDAAAFTDAWYAARPEWVSGNVGPNDTKFLYQTVLDARTPLVLEVGTASGFSTGVIAMALEAARQMGRVGNDYRVVTYDVSTQFYARPEFRVAQAGEIQVEPEIWRHVEVRAPATALDAARELGPNAVSLAFIDADHRHPWPVLDLLAILDTMKPGGVVLLHDVNLPLLFGGQWQDWGAKYLYDDAPTDKWTPNDGCLPNIGALRIPADKVAFRQALLTILDRHEFQTTLPVDTYNACTRRSATPATPAQPTPKLMAMPDSTALGVRAAPVPRDIALLPVDPHRFGAGRRDMARDALFATLFERARPFTETPVERMYALYQAVRYIVEQQVPGDVVECGAWRGGAALFVADLLHALGDTDRRLFVYDTCAGMPEPGAEDRRVADGVPARTEWEFHAAAGEGWWRAPLGEVQATLAMSAFSPDRVTFVPGMVEASLPGTIPTRVALMRLDTSWYASTRHALHQLYPRLVPGGVLLLESYGYWTGAQQATDEYFGWRQEPLLLTRTDESGRLALKPLG